MPTINTVEQNVKTNETILKFEKVVHYYNCKFNRKNEICFRLGALSLEIFRGELLVLLGPSGSGKSTILRLISGLEWPHEGTIALNGRVVADKTVKVKPEDRGVGMVFQDHALFPHLTVKENIVFGIQNWTEQDKERRLIELEDLLGLKNFRSRYPYELSGGQQQRVALARTLAPKPTVVLLDEPLSNVDVELRSVLAENLKNILKKEGVTGVWVTHDQNEAYDIADRVMVIRDGRIEQTDAPWELYNHPKTRFVADFIGEAVFLTGQLKDEMIVTEIATFKSPVVCKPGKKIEIMVRPEAVSAIPHDGGLGTITNRKFQGYRQLYTILLPTGQKVLSYQPANRLWPNGTKVQLTINSENLIVFQS